MRRETVLRSAMFSEDRKLVLETHMKISAIKVPHLPQLSSVLLAKVKQKKNESSLKITRKNWSLHRTEIEKSLQHYFVIKVG